MEENRKLVGSGDENDKLALKLTSELLQSGKWQRSGARLEWLGYTSVRVRHLVHGFIQEKQD
jgi:hypothetical protein